MKFKTSKIKILSLNKMHASDSSGVVNIILSVFSVA